MPATSTSTSTSPGKCVVCGKETWMRCSSCSAHGLDWMCFCSVEHQKLIWPVHKRVCSSNPFEWPSLSQREVKQYIELSTRRIPQGAHKSTSWIEKQAEGKDTSVEQAKLDFEVLLREFGPSNSNLSIPKIPRLIRLRADAFYHKALSNTPSDQGLLADNRSLASSAPLDYLAHFESSMFPDVASNPSLASWSSNLHHRLLIYNYLLSISSAPTMERYAFMAKAGEIIGEFAQNEIEKTHPQEANKVNMFCGGGLFVVPPPPTF